MFANGPRIGWTGGGLGSLLWLPALALVSLSQGCTVVGIADLLILALGICYLWIFAPWKWPETRLYVLFGGLVALLLAAGIFNALMLLPRSEWGWRNLWWLGFFFIFIVPGASFGNKTWREIHGDQG